MTFNIDNAVDMLARVEIARLSHQHEQATFGHIPRDALPPGDLVFDEETGLPVGVGSCNTSHCAAGWALQNAGIRVRWEDQGRNGLIALYAIDGSSISVVACALLGIDGPPEDEERTYDDSGNLMYEDADKWNFDEGFPRIFDIDNSIDDLYRLTAAWMPESEEDNEALLRRLVSDRMPTLAAGLPG